MRRDIVNKQAVIDAKERDGKIIAKPIPFTDSNNLKGFIDNHIKKDSNVIIDEYKVYIGMKNHNHYSVCHSAKKYVNGMAHTNGIESFCALLKRDYQGTHHHMINKHLKSYVNEFAGRHNTCKLNTIEQMNDVAFNMVGKQLTYKDLVA